jgi:hypothetical protein
MGSRVEIFRVKEGVLYTVFAYIKRFHKNLACIPKRVE